MRHAAVLVLAAAALAGPTAAAAPRSNRQPWSEADIFDWAYKVVLR
jgi:hypothetical protein